MLAEFVSYLADKNLINLVGVTHESSIKEWDAMWETYAYGFLAKFCGFDLGYTRDGKFGPRANGFFDDYDKVDFENLPKEPVLQGLQEDRFLQAASNRNQLWLSVANDILRAYMTQPDEDHSNYPTPLYDSEQTKEYIDSVRQELDALGLLEIAKSRLVTAS